MTYVSLSLDAPVGETEDAPTLIEMIDPHATADTPSESESLQLQMKIDIARMLKGLTSRQRKLCHLLRDEGLNVKEAAQQMKLPRATVYDELKRIKAVFQREGLEDYLKR
jgi:RNA polymerase sigma-70 factor (ECF subfamily)